MISQLDHLVLTVENVEKTIAFYEKVFQMEAIAFDKEQKALQFGNQKIILQEIDDELELLSKNPTAGSAMLCFVSSKDITEIIAHLNTCKIPIVKGPVKQIGANGSVLSVYVEDLDGNMIEIVNY